MGKSPGKWIKTLIFGKKSSRSNASKGREISATSEKEVHTMRKGAPADLVLDSSSISQPLPVRTDSSGGNSRVERGTASSLPCDGEIVLSVSQDAVKQGTVSSDASNGPERFREEQAAIKAQAAFRGYLARRAFRALRGIIRLQALVRGHLVRRQAVATLHCFEGIIKLQALVRGQIVRLSDIGTEVHTKCGQENAVDAKPLDSLGVNISTGMERMLANAFVSKLLASLPVTMALQIQYIQDAPNSTWNWLERWTFTCFREPVPQLKKAGDLKSNTKSTAVNPVSVRSKRTVRKISAANNDSSSTHITSESEKPKRSSRKVSRHTVDSVQEPPQNELEKVKCNLRKISNPTTEVCDQPTEAETEKLQRSHKKASTSQFDVPDQGIVDSAEKKKDASTLASPDQPHVETAAKPVEENGSVDTLNQLVTRAKDGNISVGSEMFSSNEQACHENQKASRRRASFSGNEDPTENGAQRTPKLPSYMAATESAKAKLRGQGSPRLSSDGAEKNGYTRRYSLPSATNGKLGSLSPRAQILIQASGKGGSLRSDRSLLSSRDGNERFVQVEWRR